jgi:hypothetical protein
MDIVVIDRRRGRIHAMGVLEELVCELLRLRI